MAANEWHFLIYYPDLHNTIKAADRYNASYFKRSIMELVFEMRFTSNSKIRADIEKWLEKNRIESIADALLAEHLKSSQWVTFQLSLWRSTSALHNRKIFYVFYKSLNVSEDEKI